MKKNILYLLMLILLVTACIKEDPIKMKYEGYKPVENHDEWQLSSPEDENMDPGLVRQAYDLFYSEDEFPMANALIIARNGKIVAEAYCKDPGDIDRLNNLQSCTKSFTSLLTGIAIGQGLITNIDQSLNQFYPEYFTSDDPKRGITIRNCLTMRTGIEFINSDNTEELYRASNSLEYILSLPLVYSPGVVFEYNDGAPHLVGAAINRVSGKSLEEYARENLFNPMGISDIMWESGADGLNFGAFSLYLKPRDLLKVGQMMAQDGAWKGIQLVDLDWIREATTIQSGTESSYGYYFWVMPAIEGYMMIGHGGQFLYVCESKQLVVAYTAFPYINDIFFGDSGKLAELIYRSAR